MLAKHKIFSPATCRRIRRRIPDRRQDRWSTTARCSCGVRWGVRSSSWRCFARRWPGTAKQWTGNNSFDCTTAPNRSSTQGRIQPVRLGGAISAILVVKFHWGFAALRGMCYTLQHYFDKTIDDEMALYRECCFTKCKKSRWIKLLSYVSRGEIAPTPPAPVDPTLSRASFIALLQAKAICRVMVDCMHLSTVDAEQSQSHSRCSFTDLKRIAGKALYCLWCCKEGKRWSLSTSLIAYARSSNAGQTNFEILYIVTLC